MKSEAELESPPSADEAQGASQTLDGAVSLDKAEQLKRGLKSRHIQFMALGGAIGTGLFVGSGAILALVGPVPLWLGYLSMMLVVWVVMNTIAEMTTYLPMKGITMPYFTNRYVDSSLAFASGWNYWYAYAILVAAEASAGAILLDYWKTPVPTGVWITIILVVCLLLNIIAVEVFGEAEFWFASIKFITITGLIILGIVIMAGGVPEGGATGFRYWNDPGAFKEYVGTGATGRFTAYWTAFVRAGFSFITSPELIGLAAGETIAPRRNIPKAARRFIYRLALFYGVSSLIIGAIVPSDDRQLLSETSDAGASPWVIGIQRAGIKGLNHVINAAILTSAWSAGNAFLYSGSRILYSLAATGQAPVFFARTTKRGVPYAAVLATWAVSLLAFLNVSTNGAQVFLWFSNISTISGFIAWIIVLITYLRFRSALKFRGLLGTLPYRTIGQPYLAWGTLVVFSVLTITNGFQVFSPFKYQDFLAAYITIPVFFLLYLGHKLWFRTPICRKIDEIDVITGKKEMDEFCENDRDPVPKNFLQRVWFWLA
ncbi:amino acid permease/ SLC12A domain-containing protein [Chaetomium sp. MPI-SDFR-AT-0129]|uniref:Amino acid permease/ SLC12A domain-containing protein n=1 Tax=Dichotomopilus funicola TaxID=1934379 RepID=A0AAN6V409_9PEZI|nr:amino acid permease/ SLC12A domain-containing protein [Chaetomium sp. MPI-SDFR-AT-0129]KAK4144448.1 amino acid permease/ SLC12A domain-containing protein [Dichotomopilus funicola]